MCGTDLAYGTTRYPSKTSARSAGLSAYARPTQCPVLTRVELAKRAALEAQRVALQVYLPTRMLCGVRYSHRVCGLCPYAYAMLSGTHIAHGAICVWSASLRVYYAIRGTDLAYAARSLRTCHALCGTDAACTGIACGSMSNSSRRGGKSTAYRAKSTAGPGTNRTPIAYAAMRCAVLVQRMMLWCGSSCTDIAYPAVLTLLLLLGVSDTDIVHAAVPAYARATRCPVLTWRMVLPVGPLRSSLGRGATRCR
eukprot:1033875-Rhodomonas_salina.4